MSGPQPGSTRQWRRAGLAFVLVAVATAAVAAAQLTREDAPAAEGAVASDTGPGNVPSVSPSATVPGEPTTDTGRSPAFRCWSGSEVPTSENCPEPTGAAGLAWVFPSLDLDSCTDLLATGAAPQLRQLYGCRESIDGRDVTIAYAEWRSEADALNYYDQQSPRRVSIRGPGGRPLRFGWLDVAAGGRFTGALAYTDAPFSVFVSAPDAATRSAAGRDLIRLRPTAELSGVPLPR